ncbi:serine hydroxymethyltransferase [Oryzihumus sp.]|uniref:serine hydroxymethyltransferase n=1 Tax=Oryzihumus sp. TaxID=1968903 RepID=UPI002EDA892A
MTADQTFYGPDFGALQAQDPEIAGVLLSELDRVRSGLQLIASENLTSPAVLAALGSTLTNKYAEGYPGRRYYGGCSEVDKAESIGIERAKKLFGADHANLQPHSGASANQAVYGAFCQPGDTILAMSLPHGGHLTHGTKVSFSGKWFNAVHYGVNKDTEDIDYDQVRDLAREHKPKVIIAGGSAIPRLIDFQFFREVADEVGAIFWVDAAHFIGLVAGQAIPSPVPFADVVTFTTHKVLRGPRGGALVCKEEHAAKLDKAVFPMMQGGPLMHAIAAKAVNFGECLRPEYQTYARQVIANAQQLAASLGEKGIRPITGGTDTHLSLHDLQGVGVTGKDAEARSDAAGIVLNKNAIPFDPQPPNTASGIRVGTPSVTTQGMGTQEMKVIADLIHRAVTQTDGDPDHPVAKDVRAEVGDLVSRFPAYARG